MKGRGGNGRSPIKPSEQRHRPARLPHAKIRSDPAGDRIRIALGGGEQAYNSLDSHSGGSGFDSWFGHPDFGSPWFSVITPGECWVGFLTKAIADSFPILPMQLAARQRDCSPSHQGEPGSNPGRVAFGFSHVGIVPDDAVERRIFFGDLPSPHPPPPLFRRCSILTSPHHRLDVKGSSNISTPLSSCNDKIDFKRVYTKVNFVIGTEFNMHTLDDSEPIAALQANKKRIPYNPGLG
ncbi:hypothetical protein PR048_000204 [Dryococelus australis]|uniref:Uncharacterized protein n=1 Tax=Dryococelus australis TaxID=614101 RepID=A0ABQ9IDY8_9NEOP|nr:hypothetical protein PR048_000204 [Dryococelus australis]